MQQLSPFEIKQRLLTALDTEYNVVDMATVLEIVTILERTPITKEALETTRLGRDINELRRKTRNESLAKRAKDLVRRWRDLIIPPQTGGGSHPTVGGTSSSCGAGISAPDSVAPAETTSQHPQQQQPQQQNGKSSSRSSTLPKSAPISPAISLPASDRSSVVSPALSASVDRTHASNKRLRKDGLIINIGDGPTVSNPCSPAATSSADEYLHESAAKRIKLDPSLPRVNGDHYSDSVGSDCEIVSVTPVNVAIPPPKQKNRRKKAPKDRTGSGAGGSAGGEDDIVKEKIASIARLHKVKTTQELLAGLQSRSTDANSPASFSSSVDHDVAKNKSEHIHRFLRSQERGDNSVKSEEDELEDGVESGSGDEEKKSRRKSNKKTDLSTRLREPSPPPAPPFPTPEEILARLPPLDLASIRWDDDDIDEALNEPQPPLEVTEADVDRLLSEPMEGLNGNTERWPDGSTEFRTWDQVFTTPMAMPPPPPPPPPNSTEPAPPPPPSHGYLFILPYVVID